MPFKKGKREVALAIQAVTSRVTVTLTASSFVVTPANLFKLTFNDPAVGIDNKLMDDFKESLKELLKGENIPDVIDHIPNDATRNIGTIADFISTALALK